MADLPISPHPVPVGETCVSPIGGGMLGLAEWAGSDWLHMILAPSQVRRCLAGRLCGPGGGGRVARKFSDLLLSSSPPPPPPPPPPPLPPMTIMWSYFPSEHQGEAVCYCLPPWDAASLDWWQPVQDTWVGALVLEISNTTSLKLPSSGSFYLPPLVISGESFTSYSEYAKHSNIKTITASPAYL